MTEWRHRVRRLHETDEPYCHVDAQDWPCDAERMRLRAERAEALIPDSLDVERLAAAMDKHWLFRTDDGVFHCTADDWTLGPDRTIAEGDRVYPFTQHVATAVAAALREGRTP